MRRHRLGPVLVVALVVLAGCGGGGGGAGEDASTRPLLTGTASAAELDTTTQTETGVTETGRVRENVTTTISATIQGDVELRTTRRVNVTTVSVSYQGSETVFGTYSVPGVEPFERADLVKNPVEGVGPTTLATRAQRTYTVDELSKAGETTVTLLGNETTAVRYEGTATRTGECVDVDVVVATVYHDGDYVTAAVITEGDLGSVETLFGGVRH